MSSRYDDPRWYEEQEPHASLPGQPAYDDLSEDPFFSQNGRQAPPNNTLYPQTAYMRKRQVNPGKYILVVLLIVAAFAGGWFSHQQFGYAVPLGSDSNKYSQLFQQAWSIIDQNYVDRENVNYKKMSYSAIQSMVDSLNDRGHTRFMTPEQVQSENQSLSGKYTGIGVTLAQDPKTKQWVIESTIPGAPAEKAGLKHGDIIISVNGTPVTNKQLSEVSSLIQGKAGTNVTLVIQHPGEQQQHTFTLARAEIEVPNVLMHYIKEDHIAHIQIVQFAAGVADQLKKDVNDAKKMGAQKIILDLRDNPGGYLNEAVDTASLFVKSGNVLLEKDSSNKRTPVPVNGDPIDTTTPIVVLVNGHSASAAEIVTAALKDNNRAQVIGEKTFGTGTVLEQFKLADGSAILVGTQEWLTPKGDFIRDNGIQPNTVVKLEPPNSPLTPATEDSDNLTEQQILSGKDTQLIAAINYLKSH